MIETIRLESSTDVIEALTSSSLAPSPRPDNIRPGATADLRKSMARFSYGNAHQLQRQRVVVLIDALDPSELETRAFEETQERLGSEEIDAIAELANIVPTRVLAGALGVPRDEMDQLVRDVLSMVETIGRGSPSTSETDRAVSRILDRLSHNAVDAVAAASVLYQNHDATAALITVSLEAYPDPTSRRQAVSTTSRFALADTEIGSTFIRAGSTVTLDLETAGLEFGAGPHTCPGRSLAEEIVRGVTRALDHHGCQLARDRVVTGTDGRATCLPLVKAQ